MLAFESASFSNFSLLLLLLDCSWDSRMISKSFLWGSFIYTSRNNPLFFWKGQDSWNSTQSQPPLGNPLCSSQNTVRFVKQNQALVKLGCLFLFTSSFTPSSKIHSCFLWLVFQSCRGHSRLMDKDQPRFWKPNSTTSTVESGCTLG